MRRSTCVASVSMVVCIVGTALGQPVPELPPADIEKAESLRQDLRHMVALARDRVFPALVNIRVITVRYWDGKEQKGQAVGSGTIISPEGHVLTNFHVAENGKKFRCTLADKSEISATLVGEDPLTDLAVLKLDLSERTDSSTPLPYAKFGDSSELQIGDPVMAMGSPWALSRSVTYGIVSNTERVFAVGDDEVEEERFDRNQRTGLFNRWIQHDAAINPGNSGGPLVNLRGEVVGVNARGMFGGGDMGFAIPANVAKAVAEALIKHGEVPRSWYGLTFKSIKKSGHKEGVLINSVLADSPAEKAGIRAGDVVVAIDGKSITVRFPEEIPELMKDLADRPIGSQVRMTYERNGTRGEATITTDRLKRDKGDEAAFKAWGITAEDITERMAYERRLESTDGVLVSSVRSGSPAALAEPAIAFGDVIKSVDGRPVHNLKDFAEIFESIMKSDNIPDSLLIEFESGGRNNITTIKPKPDKDEDPPREVAKAWIGVATQPVVPKLARQLGLGDVLGFRITRVYPNTLAAQTELKAGDIIVELNGEKLRPQGMQDAGMFQRAVRRLNIDDTATLAVLRGGERVSVDVKLERSKLTVEEARRDVNRDFELTVREVTFFDRDENRWKEDVQGVLVVGVESAGWASLGGLRPRDLIQRINEYEIVDLKSYRQAMEEIKKAEPARVVFVVLRGVSTSFLYCEPDWHPVGAKDEGSAQPAESGQSE